MPPSNKGNQPPSSTFNKLAEKNAASTNKKVEITKVTR